MKEHDCRILNEDEEYYSFYGNGIIYHGTMYGRGLHLVVYVDSNNFLHNLNGFAWDNKKFTKFSSYSIHGKEYSKEQWDIERNRLLILDEIC